MDYNYGSSSGGPSSSSGPNHHPNYPIVNGTGPSSHLSGSGGYYAPPSHPSHNPAPHGYPPPPLGDNKFNLIDWYPNYLACQRHFLEVAQHSIPCQAQAAFINIRLPCQREAKRLHPDSAPIIPPALHHAGHMNTPPALSQPHPQDPPNPYGWVSLYPYIRRLVAAGMDTPEILEGWFGERWMEGVSMLHEQERRNFLFAAKSGSWSEIKRDYDAVTDECVPFLMPLRRVEDEEIDGAEQVWSNWLAMQDWMLGRSRGLNDEEHHMAP